MSRAEFIPTASVATGASQRSYLKLKRIGDILICSLSLIFLIPLLALIAIAIVLDSPGSFLFVQERIGKDGRPFWMYKFRTMVAKHDSSEEQKYMAGYVKGTVAPEVGLNSFATYKSAKVTDITRVGRLLRSLSLDELPQFWNVFRGEMSLIGPRPNVTWEAEHYSTYQFRRLAVLPGITGLAQVRGRSKITFDEIVEHDLEYIRNMSLKLDLQIVWWTLVKVFDYHEAG